MPDRVRQQTASGDCVCGGTGLLTTLTEDGGYTGPFICPRCYVRAAERDRYRAERDRLRAELQEAHTWLEGAGIDDCEHRGYEGTKLCRFAEALRDIPDQDGQHRG